MVFLDIVKKRKNCIELIKTEVKWVYFLVILTNDYANPKENV